MSRLGTANLRTAGVTPTEAVAIVTQDQVPATWLDATPGSAAWCRCTAALRGGGAVFPDRTGGVPSLDQAQLSSLADGVHDLAKQAAQHAEQLDQGASSEAANSLFEAERS